MEDDKQILIYDDRKKELTQKKSKVIVNKRDEEKDADGKVIKKEEIISTVSQRMNAVYTEAGIILAHKNLSEERTFLEKRVSDLKKKQKDAGEMTDDLKELKEKLAKLQKIDAAEKNKTEIEATEERLNDVTGQIKEMRDVIGSRLKL